MADSSRNEKRANAGAKSRSVHPECTKPPKTAQKRGEREPYKQEATGSSPVPPTIKSITYDANRMPENSRISALAADFVHLLCTSGLHGTLTLYPAPSIGLCQVCGVWIGVREDMSGHQFDSRGTLIRARCPDHEDDSHAPLHGVTVCFPSGDPPLKTVKPPRTGNQAMQTGLAEAGPACS